MMHDVEVWLLVDELGNHVCSPDKDELAQLYEDSVGNGAEMARRVLKLLVSVSVPEFVTLSGAAPAEGEATLDVVESQS